MKIPGRYVAMFLMASGYAGFAMTLVWVSNAIPRPPAYESYHFAKEFAEPCRIDRKRAAAMGIVNGIGNLGNLFVAVLDLLFFALKGLRHAELDHTRGRQNGAPNITNLWLFLSLL
ncbi:hypothetical protein C0989_008668 [Termitomyces sp. Mn162]|nr:hypothetical protein C0989_008668 [Termitomyces sp. Mn162]